MSPNKRKYFTLDQTSITLALESVRKLKTGINEASRIYGVPEATWSKPKSQRTRPLSNL